MDQNISQLIKDWLGIAAILFVWTGAVWRAWITLNNKITAHGTDLNSLGGRVDGVKADCIKHETEIGNLKMEQQRSSDDRGILREKVAMNAKSIDALTEELREERLAVITMIHNNEKAAAERDTTLRVELAGIRERLNIETMIKSVVRNIKEN
jgi:hypothetical protein